MKTQWNPDSLDIIDTISNFSKMILSINNALMTSYYVPKMGLFWTASNSETLDWLLPLFTKEKDKVCVDNNLDEDRVAFSVSRLGYFERRQGPILPLTSLE